VRAYETVKPQQQELPLNMGDPIDVQVQGQPILQAKPQ
jgi:hypothetical protein